MPVKFCNRSLSFWFHLDIPVLVMGKIYGEMLRGKFMEKIYEGNLRGKFSGKICGENLWGKFMLV